MLDNENGTNMGRKVLRTKEELDQILGKGGLELAEDYDATKSYPKDKYLLCRCKFCKTEAHYRLKYVMHKAEIGEVVCRACYWNAWMGSTSPLGAGGSESNFLEYSSYVEKYGFDLINVLKDGGLYKSIFLVVCKHCGRQTVERSSDIHFKCSCQSHPNTARHYVPKVTRVVIEPQPTHIQRTFLTIEEAQITRCSDVPEIMEDWDDPRSPFETMVYPTNWSGMCPGDGQYRFKCKNGHHPYAFPYSYLQLGCPACRGQATKGTGLFLADTNPEIAAEWINERNGAYNPSNVRDNSKRKVWWRCLACKHEWLASPRDRQRKDGQLCPNCGKIQGSIAWVYPKIADEWDTSNPMSAWQVRPSTKLNFAPLWTCDNNPSHKYQASVSARIKGASCPECSESNKSRIELKYFSAINDRFSTARSGAKFENASFSYNWTVDISFSVLDKKFAIEYDGFHWHQEKMDIDERKSRELLEAGFIVIRIRESGLDSLCVDSPFYRELLVKTDAKYFDDSIKQLMTCIDGYINGDEVIAQHTEAVTKMDKIKSTRTSSKAHSWTAEEERFLLEHDNMTARDLAEHFGVSRKAVERKRAKLRKRQ